MINLLMGLVQCADHFRWRAMHIMLVDNPVANLILLAIGVALAPMIRRQAQGASVRPYVFVAIVLPLFMIPCQAIVPYNLYEFLRIENGTGPVLARWVVLISAAIATGRGQRTEGGAERAKSRITAASDEPPSGPARRESRSATRGSPRSPCEPSVVRLCHRAGGRIGVLLSSNAPVRGASISFVLSNAGGGWTGS